MSKSLTFRKAGAGDIEEIILLDGVTKTEPRRKLFIRRNVEAGNCWVTGDGEITGYGVIEHTFFGRGFISMIFIREDVRRKGLGVALLRHLEKQCETEKVFTSTNLSNTVMQEILRREGYRLCGSILELDEGDPEL